MTRLADCFTELKKCSSTALIPYIMASDPNPEISLELMHKMVEAGADIIEIGAPFSDPMADGPVIQAAAERSLKHKTSLKTVFTLIKAFRQQNNNTPIVLMGYLNPIETMGYQKFAKNAAQAGIDGIITVDMPPEEADDYVKALKSNQIDPIFLLAPTSTEQRIKKLTKVASGFVYYVSLKGVTGSSSLDVDTVDKKLVQIRQHIKLPIAVGFGISNATSAAKVAKIAQGVVVGSVLVKKMTQNQGKSKAERAIIINSICELLSDMRNTIDGTP